MEPALGALAALHGPIAAARGVDELAAAARAIVPTAGVTLADMAARPEPLPGVPGSPGGSGREGMSGALVDAGAFTSVLSTLNDEICIGVVKAVAVEMGMDLGQACWLAFGSQARGEQTLLTDQDNGLVFAAETEAEAEARRPAWLAFGQRVNEALALCGYPLCDGRVMAGQPLCCLSPQEWCRRFEHWMAHGDGNDLFAARIYFDLRPMAGNLALARPLVEMLRSPAAAVPRFVKQMADIVLCNHVPMNWLGQVVTTVHAGQPMFDLKMSGTALFVDAGRLWALAHRLEAVGTEPRLRAAAREMRVPAGEVAEWVAGFHALLRLRLLSQRARPGTGLHGRAWVPWQDLGAAARSELKGALRAARLVQQRIALDYRR